jgi:hypothetical protein
MQLDVLSQGDSNCRIRSLTILNGFTFTDRSKPIVVSISLEEKKYRIFSNLIRTLFTVSQG